MNNKKIEEFYVVGISVRTTNQNGQAGKDIPSLWQKFMEEGVHQQIPNKLSNAFMPFIRIMKVIIPSLIPPF